MKPDATRTICASCGKDLTGQYYRENRKGLPVCVACDCAQVKRSGHSGVGGTRKCSFCHKQMKRRKCHKNRYGEYVCLSCLEKGRRWSRRRALWAAAWKYRYVAMYVALGAAGLLAFYKILDILVNTQGAES
jgi:hypothetical protein